MRKKTQRLEVVRGVHYIYQCVLRASERWHRSWALGGLSNVLDNVQRGVYGNGGLWSGAPVMYSTAKSVQ
jgi:hypothetical protein